MFDICLFFYYYIQYFNVKNKAFYLNYNYYLITHINYFLFINNIKIKKLQIYYN